MNQHISSPTDVLRRVVSGGQTGADRGGFEAALDVGLQIGGWAPSGFRAEDGGIPEPLRRHMKEGGSYPARTAKNVRDSDATLIVSFSGWNHHTPGTALTVRECRRQQKPCREVWLPQGRYPGEAHFRPVAEQLAEWVLGLQVRVLNVAGPRESKQPGIQLAARQVLAHVLDLLMGDRARVAREAGR